MGLPLIHSRVVLQALARIRIPKALHTKPTTNRLHLVNQGIGLLQRFTRCYHFYLEEAPKEITQAGPAQINQTLHQSFLHQEGSLHLPATLQILLTDMQSQLQVHSINHVHLAL